MTLSETLLSSLLSPSMKAMMADRQLIERIHFSFRSHQPLEGVVSCPKKSFPAVQLLNVFDMDFLQKCREELLFSTLTDDVAVPLSPVIPTEIVSQMQDVVLESSSSLGNVLDRLHKSSDESATEESHITLDHSEMSKNSPSCPLKGNPFVLKNNDLYMFWQSSDVAAMDKLSCKSLKQLHTFLSSPDFVQWLSDMTGIELSAGHSVDLAGQRYPCGGHLLCHDDAITEDAFIRRVAFIIYLVPCDWNGERDGGRLDLFEVNSDTGLPIDKVAGSIVPQWNSMAFFEVTPTSYHQVSEVLCSDKERVSLTGWFYGPPKTFSKPNNPCVFTPSPIPFQICNETLQDWISPEYLSSDAIQRIRNSFVDNSFAELNLFIRPDRFQHLHHQLRNLQHLSVKPYHPAPNVFRYSQITATDNTSALARFQFFLQSIAFRDYLRSITNLTDLNCVLSSEFRSFGKADYTLVHDHVPESYGLDVWFGFSGTRNEHNDRLDGSLIYMDDEQTLLDMPPCANQLGLVYREEGVMRFVKYITQASNVERTEISMVIGEEK